MSFFEEELDITKKIKVIEKLKSSMLSQIAYLYSNMAEEDSNTDETYLDILSDVLILTYLLSNKLGAANEALDIKVINKLKVEMLNNNEWQKEMSELQRHLLKSRNLHKG
ncbi:MazG-like nucleotide pyrophosphohydrolase family protein [Natranaerovirga hydrolytica]|uniref:MazG-like nucleotide pyrophosphohydrolase family protein n=1 Tax=Natranaerovirga hydrolytica TaxID=680378 RepID=A0A4R1N9E8_9FIRM|nr:MazG-like family protein [Natranaerovirga hydrolytica]TCK99734.1 MazG-like nucleotide pyrophosphohydrolase family protein [Natranaerovirga hydrolytica]